MKKQVITKKAGNRYMCPPDEEVPEIFNEEEVLAEIRKEEEEIN